MGLILNIFRSLFFLSENQLLIQNLTHTSEWLAQGFPYNFPGNLICTLGLALA